MHGSSRGTKGRLLTIFGLLSWVAHAQQWDVGGRLTDALSTATENRFHLSFEQVGRYEVRTNSSFNRGADVDTGLYRTRVGLTYTPLPWLRFSGMLQDSRAPWYGAGANESIHDGADLQEGYIELFPSTTGFGLTAGRMMINYGEARLIGSPQWSNISRTYDQARVYYRTAKARLEVLLVSPVKLRNDGFNRPVLGERVIGTYNTFKDFYKKHLLDVYFLRHQQNRPGGFTSGSKKDGTDRLATNTWGLRLAGPLLAGAKYSLEGALQNGDVGPAQLNAAAWFASVSRGWTLHGHTLDVSGEYKFASGTPNPSDPLHSGTFDQISPANHDKFGREDLFGWRNMHNARSLSTLQIVRGFSLSFMYDDVWLVCLKDGIYNSSGKVIARSAAGTAGRHVGRETDIYGTYRYKHFLFGGGYGHLFTGGFLRQTTPGASPTYLYLFHTYTL